MKSPRSTVVMGVRAAIVLGVVMASAAPAAAKTIALDAPAGALPRGTAVDLKKQRVTVGAIGLPIVDVLYLPEPPDAPPVVARVRVDSSKGLVEFREKEGSNEGLYVARFDYMTDLLTARALEVARKRLDADAKAEVLPLLAPFIEQRPFALYAALVGDAKLAPLVERDPATKKLAAGERGGAKVVDLKTRLVARSEKHGLFALVRTTTRFGDPVGGDEPGERDVELTILDATGQVVTSVPLLPPLFGDENGKWRWKDAVPTDKRIAERIAVANRILADLGFEVVEDAEIVSFEVSKAYTPVARFRAAKLGLAIKDGTLRLLARDEVLAEKQLFPCTQSDGRETFSCSYEPTYLWAAWLPSRQALIVVWHTSHAEHSDPNNFVTVWDVGAAAP